MTNKVALVTGGAQGMGLGICTQLLSEGFRVISTFTKDEKSLVVDLESKYSQLVFHEVDLANEDALRSFITGIGDQSFDAIVNQATYFEFERFDQFDYAVWNRTIAFNLTAPMIICHELKKQIRDGGAIINISSTDAFVGAFASTSYAVSKLGLISLTKSFANNLGARNIRVNAIAAGWIGSVELGDVATMNESTTITPLMRMGSPLEVAEVVSFLISSKSSFINGTTVVVDGGYTSVDIIGKKEASSLNI